MFMKSIRRVGIAAAASVFLLGLMPQAAFATQEADVAEEPITESSEYQEAVKDLALDVDVQSGESGNVSTTLSDGTVLSLGIEPVAGPPVGDGLAQSARALTGWYKISGNNGLAYMEYYIRLAPVSPGSIYTKIAQVDQNSLVINAWAGTSFSGGTVVIRRTNETATAKAWVQGRAVFTYGGGLLTMTGGVQALVWDGRVGVSLW